MLENKPKIGFKKLDFNRLRFSFSFNNEVPIRVICDASLLWNSFSIIIVIALCKSEPTNDDNSFLQVKV